MRLLAAIALLLLALPAHAQNMQNALVVSACGAPALTTGPLADLTMNPAGQLCLGGTFGIASVWNAADAAANGMTLSNGGLTVTPSGSGSWGTIRTSTSNTSGKLYIELSTAPAATGALILGLASAGFNVVDYLGDNNYSAGLQLPGGFTYVSTGFTSVTGASGGAMPANSVLAIAIDFTTNKIWMAINNIWQSGNPSAGTGPVLSFLPATVGALFPAISFNGANAGVWTLKATAASQTYAPPTGFKAWDAP